MTEPAPTLAEQTATAVTTAFPGLRQSAPYSVGKPLAAVTLEAASTARYTWGPYEVHVAVGQEDHLNRDDENDTSLQRQVRAHAVLAVADLTAPDVRGHVEWQMQHDAP
ncbi:hypothetical protein ACFVYD_28410 [Streptomyces sp. NPDC058301]|uniref:hypothetical protein n=1 Tax=Streptomyces sp. NPDC058301 TaxID=3346436 RepID=UPI0036E87983